MKKKFLFVMRKAPHDGIWVQEMLDMILTAAAFDQPVKLAFLDDGVFQLKKGQAPGCLALKDIAPIFQVFDLYDVEDLFVEQESLAERGLCRDDLVIPAQLFPRERFADLLIEQDVIVGY